MAWLSSIFIWLLIRLHIRSSVFAASRTRNLNYECFPSNEITPKFYKITNAWRCQIKGEQLCNKNSFYSLQKFLKNNKHISVGRILLFSENPFLGFWDWRNLLIGSQHHKDQIHGFFGFFANVTMIVQNLFLCKFDQSGAKIFAFI